MAYLVFGIPKSHQSQQSHSVAVTAEGCLGLRAASTYGLWHPSGA